MSQGTITNHPDFERRGRAYAPEEVLPFVGEGRATHDFDGDLVNVTSLRLRTFKVKGPACPCGLVGSRFYKERHPRKPPAPAAFWDVKGPRYHLNLYAVDPKTGLEVLMTHDHVRPRSKGGADRIENAQTMCGPCNWKKGDSYEEPAPSASSGG